MNLNYNLLSTAFFCIFHTSLVFIFSSCKSDYHKVSPLLTQAEEVLQSYPDSAYLLLQQVDTVSLTPVQRAHYCYLFTAASDKLGHTITWPDAMRQAAEIYAPVAKDNDTKARLYYYAGMANQRNHRDSVAVACFYRSLDYQDESIPTRLLVFTYEGLYLSYYNQNYFTEACEFIEKAVVLCKKTQNKIGEVWALHQYAHTLMCIKERERKGSKYWKNCVVLPNNTIFLMPGPTIVPIPLYIGLWEIMKRL